MTDRYLIVGLGNPGKEYENTRHNIGFRSVDAIAQHYHLLFSKKQNKALIADGNIGDKKVIIAKPQTFMNLSGEAVRPLLDFYKIPLTQLIVIMDDMDVPLGTLRIREKGSAGGQNGMKNILQHVGTQEVARIRFGIGRPPGKMTPSAYVLQPFAKNEEIDVIETADRVRKAVELWLKEGLQVAMNRFNGTSDDAAKNAPAPDKPALNKVVTVKTENNTAPQTTPSTE